MHLMGRDAFLAGGHQEQGGKPFGQRDFGTFKYGLDRDGELFATDRRVALVHARAVRFAFELGHFAEAAVRANRAFRPNPRFQPLTGCGFILKDRVIKKVRRHGQ